MVAFLILRRYFLTPHDEHDVVQALRDSIASGAAELQRLATDIFHKQYYSVRS